MKNASLIVALSLIATAVRAQNFERIAPQLPASDATIGLAQKEPKTGGSSRLAHPEAVLIKDLRGLRFVAEVGEIPAQDPRQHEGVVVEPSVALLARNKNFARELGATFLRKPLTSGKLELLRREIVAHYYHKGHPVVTISVPPQDVTNGVLQLVVTEARVATVRVEGNRYFRSERISGQARVHPGEVVDTHRLLADVALLNQNPFRNVDVVFEPGADHGTTDVVLRTTDRRPFRVYAGYEDTGVDITDRDRWFAGFNWGDAFFTDGLLSYQHTTSSDFESFSADALTYVTALPWHHLATFFGSYGRVKAEAIDSLVDSEGETLQLGLRYSIPLTPQTGRFVHSLVLGFDYKQTNNDLDFGGQQISSTRVHVGQFMAGYNASYKTTRSNTTLSLEGFYNPGDWVGNDSTADYQTLRADAKSEYAYLRGTLGHTHQLPNEFTAIATLTGQISTGNLVPTETLGIGGHGTVRGYEERMISTDRALIASAELRSPAFSPLRALGIQKANDQLLLLAFIDYAIAGNHKLLPNERRSTELLSVGPGLRYTINDWLSVRLDYGLALKNVVEGDDSSRVHFSAVISY